jgi:hypothetical protein
VALTVFVGVLVGNVVLIGDEVGVGWTLVSPASIVVILIRFDAKV